MKDLHDLCEFELGHKTIITDPCYSIPESEDIYNGIVTTEPGLWFGYVDVDKFGGWGNRIVRLCAFHSKYENMPVCDHQLSFHVGVDSGQAGIFDINLYQNNSIVPRDAFINVVDGLMPEENSNLTPWYCYVSNKTLSKPGFGVVEGGIVSSSGFGDGSYNVVCHKSRNDIIDAIEIRFIEDEDEETEDDYEDEE